MVAIALGERSARALTRRLERCDQLFASNLLEAELRAAAVRERVELDGDLLTWLDWVLPDRPLTDELARVLAAGYLRGADAWHVACALFVAGDSTELPFLTLDLRQRTVARRLGFPK
jgi:hypothetical protein